MDPKVTGALARLAHALRQEGGAMLRRLVFDREPRQDVEWPADLPSLDSELRAWFAWRRLEEHDDFLLTSEFEGSGTTHALIAPGGAVELYHRYRRDPTANVRMDEWRPSWVPILSNVFVDCTDGSVWFDATCLLASEPPVRVADSLAEFVDHLARTYVARGASPWRRVRLAQAGHAWAPIELPDPRRLAGLPRGAVLAFRGRRNLRRLCVKLRADTWIAAPSFSTMHDVSGGAPPPEAVEAWLDEVRGELFRVSLFVQRDVEVVRMLVRPAAGVDPASVHCGQIDVWEQEPLGALFERLDVLLRTLPEVHATLHRRPAPPDAIAALETELGRPLLPELRALFAFADGQDGGVGAPSFQHNRRLQGAAEALSTMRLMREIRDREAFPSAFWDDGLVPFMATCNGDNVCVDTAGAYGPVGAIVDYNHEDPEFRTVLHANLTQWLECFVDGLDVGLWKLEGGLVTADHDRVRHVEHVRSTEYPYDVPFAAPPERRRRWRRRE
ncbi:SMI1/KNR4 family protein [Nannocystis radixulma]|uniref:SMI1/KNR4 family protein n=1 Tax=Nannocystis radixulma TaxID=2995305 RepID=A0ABT5B0Z8_9BACT|nr:SMI1/KNR4 family protein [Nannocystis radixulma]MDC0667779.1 SMI1/KNR4 family protein [Nannocystis radixulma]